MPMPEPIPDSPENVAKAILTSKPKKDWRYVDDYKAGRLK